MKFGKHSIVLIWLMLISYSCINSKKTFEDVVPEPDQFDAQLLDSAIQLGLNRLNDSLSTDVKWTKLWYGLRSYKALWTHSTDNVPNCDTLFTFLGSSYEHGIDAGNFLLDSLMYCRSNVTNSKLSYSEMAKFDIGMSIAYIRYCRALTYGLIEPEMVLPNYYFVRQAMDTAFAQQCYDATNGHISAFLKSIQPKQSDYRALQAERVKYSKLAKFSFDSIPLLPKPKTIFHKTSDSIIPLVARRLVVSGELSRQWFEQNDSCFFDDELLKALNKFRNKTGLYIDNEVGNKTISLLNVSFADYVDKIDVNLERMRWKTTTEMAEKYIRVNVADMTLSAIRNDTTILKMNVVVGKVPKNRTPFLQSTIYEMVLNPTWTIPKSIVVKEIAKHQIRDTSYLRRHNMRVFYKGNELNPHRIDWTKIKETFQPYVVVQDSGKNNSLGRIKFNFSNRFSVYLHDTNAKSAFRRHYRALSHGCVRVERPLELAIFCLPHFDTTYVKLKEKRELLEDKLRYSLKVQIKSETAKRAFELNPDTLQVDKMKLNQGIPVLIDYLTCFCSERGKVVFRDDVYNLDAYLLACIRQKFEE